MPFTLAQSGGGDAAGWAVFLLAWVVFPAAILYALAGHLLRRRRADRPSADDDKSDTEA